MFNIKGHRIFMFKTPKARKILLINLTYIQKFNQINYMINFSKLETKILIL